MGRVVLGGLTERVERGGLETDHVRSVGDTESREVDLGALLNVALGRCDGNGALRQGTRVAIEESVNREACDSDIVEALDGDHDSLMCEVVRAARRNESNAR